MKFGYKSKSALTLLSMVVFAGTVLGVGVASAHSNVAPTAAQKQQREARYEQRLQRGVTDDKLTTEQQQAILTEHNLLTSQLQSAGTSNRRQIMQQVRQDAQTWATQHNISVSWLFGGGVKHFHTGVHRRR